MGFASMEWLHPGEDKLRSCEMCCAFRREGLGRNRYIIVFIILKHQPCQMVSRRFLKRSNPPTILFAEIVH
jgi:hypothetical protein